MKRIFLTVCLMLSLVTAAKGAAPTFLRCADPNNRQQVTSHICREGGQFGFDISIVDLAGMDPNKSYSIIVLNPPAGMKIGPLEFWNAKDRIDPNKPSPCDDSPIDPNLVLGIKRHVTWLPGFDQAGYYEIDVDAYINQTPSMWRYDVVVEDVERPLVPLELIEKSSP